MRKGFALELFFSPLRRALPYASMRKGFALTAAALALTAQFCAAQTQTQTQKSFAVYQLTDMMGLSGYRILDKEEFAKLSAQIKEEEKVFPAAMTEAKKKWDEDKTSVMNKANKSNHLPFPTTKLHPRSLKKMGSDYSDLDVAKKQLAQAESHAENNPAGNKGAAKKQNPTAEDIKREELQARAFTDASSMVRKIMGDKLGRPIPAYGFTTPEDPNKKNP